MSKLTYTVAMNDKVIVWLHGEVRTPPFSSEARVEAGYLMRRLQQGYPISMPRSRPMPVIGVRCHELRIQDTDKIWRIIYRTDADAIVILDVFQKKTKATPQSVIDNCRHRLAKYDAVE